MKKDYKIVGYTSKAGKLSAYKQTARTKDKFNEGKFRVCLESFGDKPLTFWVDEDKLCEPPKQSQEAWEKAPKETCWECGRQFTYRQCKENDGDWSEAYCGC